MMFVVDKNIPLASEVFGPLGDVVRLETSDIVPKNIEQTDVLVVRSETKVNHSLLGNSKVRFVGTTTIGTDHIDIEYLRSRNITFASAPGCNANAVKEYFVAAMLCLATQKNLSHKGKSIGVVGVGNVGSKIVQVAELFGMKVVQNDPPLARQLGPGNFVDLDDLMECDIITLHVPLTKTGQDPTYHLFDQARFSRLKPGTLFINTSRGGVVDTQGLKDAIRSSRLSYTVLDVWENEPQIDTELLSMVTLGTPHIAGYSYEGKITGLHMVYQAVCENFGFPASWTPASSMEGTAILQTSAFDKKMTDTNFLHAVVRNSYDITADDADLRRIASFPGDQQKPYFMKLRSGYRVRREFSHMTVTLPPERDHLNGILAGLGFQCAIESKV